MGNLNRTKNKSNLKKVCTFCDMKRIISKHNKNIELDTINELFGSCSHITNEQFK